MKQKSVGLTLRAFIIALALILVAGSPALPPFDGVAYAQDAPQNLTATVSPDGTSVLLSWGEVSDADSYEVWRGDGSGGSVSWGTSALATETGTTHTDSTITAGNTYSYAVRAVEGSDTGAWSNVPSVTIPGGTAAPTGAPTVSVAADGHSAVTVTWTSVTGATGYHVQFWHAGLTDWEQISGSQTSPYTHSGRTAGTQYYYVVRGFNSGGEGPWSNWRTDDSQITLEATTAKPDLTLTHVSRTTVRLDWTATTNAAQYDVERRRVVLDSSDAEVTSGDNPTTAFTMLPSALLTGLTYTDDTLTGVRDDPTHIVKYEYQVQGVASDGVRGDWSEVKSVTVPATGNRLAPPTGVTFPSITNNSIQVSWTAVRGAEYYQIQWKTGAGSYSSPIRVASPPYDHTGLNPSTQYTYQVRTVDINGPSDWTAASNETTRATPSATGQMPKVTGLTLTDETTAAGRKIKLTWNAASNATHYQIQRFTAGAWADLAGTGLTDGRLTTDAAGSPPSYVDESATLIAGGTYYYVVSAVEDGVDNTVGNADDDLGAWSDYRGITLKDNAPGTPTGLSATMSADSSVWVSWTQPEADTGATPPIGTATSWTLQWRTEGQTATWNNIAVTGRTSYHHTGLGASTTYYYRVFAKNSGGDSDVSNVDSVVLGNRLSAPTGVSAVDATNATGPMIKVSWDAVPGADSYEVQRFGNDNMWGDLDDTADAVTGETGTEVTDDLTGVDAANQPNATFLYRVRTVKEGAMSGWSATVSGTTRPTTPGAPTLSAVSTGMSMIRLSWTAVSGAINYEIQFIEGTHLSAVFENDLIQRTTIPVGGNNIHYVHMGLKAGTRYSYRMRALLANDVETVWTTNDVQPYTKPTQPDVTATAASATTMTLTWNTVPFVAGTDGLLGATNYQVQRRESGSSLWVNVLDGTPAVSGCDPVCTVTDIDLSESTHYYYRVRAVTTTTPVLTSYWDYANQRTPAAQ